MVLRLIVTVQAGVGAPAAVEANRHDVQWGVPVHAPHTADESGVREFRSH